jgi:DNA-binding transcriptional MerR regulator
MRRRSVASSSLSSNRPKAARTTLVTRTALRVLAGISEGQLVLWEHEDLIAPVSSSSTSRGELLYDTWAVRRARLIRTLTEELDVNLPGIEVILHLLDQIER